MLPEAGAGMAMETVKIPDTPFMGAVLKAVSSVDRLIDNRISVKVDMHVVGGVAVHVYTQSRVSTDIDMTLSHRLVVPETVVRYKDGEKDAYVSLDRNYGEFLAVMHPDWKNDANLLGTYGRVVLKVISPVDLAVSKIARFADNDRMDIRNLAMAGLIDADGLRRRFDEAAEFYVGDQAMMRYNLKDALSIVETWRKFEAPSDGPQP